MATDTRSISALPRPNIRQPRTTSIDLHAHLRSLILTGTLSAGTVLKQAELARVFDVSRTPMREAFRMLQEEGLIDADPNQRPRVRGLDPAELDCLYAGRIVLESIGARMTTGRLTSTEKTEARDLLAEMEAARASADTPVWLDRHRRFHHLCTARVDLPVARTIASYAEQSERYLMTYQAWHPQSFARAAREHAALLRALCGADPVLTGALMAEHLSHTAVVVLRDVGASSSAVDHALSMASGADL